MLAIRPAEEKDIIHLAELERSAATLYPEHYIPEEFKDRTLPKQVLLDALKQKLLFSALHGEIIVGFASCHEYFDACNNDKNTCKQKLLHLDEIAVHPSVGRQGIGRKLMERIFKHSKALNYQGISLTTFSDLPWNAPFYKKLGFNILAFEESPKHLVDILIEEQFLGLKNRVAMLSSNLD